MEIKMEDKQSGEQQHRSRTKPPAAAPASSHSTKRKTPAVGGEAQEAAASSRPRTKSTTSSHQPQAVLKTERFAAKKMNVNNILNLYMKVYECMYETI